MPPFLEALKDRLRGVPGYAPLRMVYQSVRDGHFRRDTLFRLTRPKNLFQYRSITTENRYPNEFGFLRDHLGDGPERRILSFGCCTGEEVFSLRSYFPAAAIKGIDINPRHIAICRSRQRDKKDTRLEFETANSTEWEETESYDAILCMAVLRHADLDPRVVTRCDPLLRFADYERTVGDFARCLKPGGFLVIRHSQFRLRDTVWGARFDTVLRVRHGVPASRLLLFGRDNRRIPVEDFEDTVFRKRDAVTTMAS